MNARRLVKSALWARAIGMAMVGMPFALLARGAVAATRGQSSQTSANTPAGGDNEYFTPDSPYVHRLSARTVRRTL